MIRSVVLFSVKEGTRPEQLDAIVRAMKAIRFEGCLLWELVRDLHLREGNIPYAFVSEFDDEVAYRAYDTHGEHNRIRRELLAARSDRREARALPVRGLVTSSIRARPTCRDIEG